VATDRASPQDAMGGGAKGGDSPGPFPPIPSGSQRALSPPRESAYPGSFVAYSSHQGVAPGFSTSGLQEEQYRVQLASSTGPPAAQLAPETSQVSNQVLVPCASEVQSALVGFLGSPGLSVGLSGSWHVRESASYASKILILKGSRLVPHSTW